MTIRKWLIDYLANGAKDAREVRKAAEQAGFRRKELQNAKKNLGIVVTNNWSKTHPVADEWYWALPED